jgi:hypothetical protein
MWYIIYIIYFERNLAFLRAEVIDLDQLPAVAGRGGRMNGWRGSPGRTVWPLAGALALLALAGCGRSAPAGPGWDFARVDAAGELLADEAALAPDCVLDRRTGLLWELKQPGEGPRGRDALYSWYNPDAAEHNSEPGLQGGGRCEHPPCDTTALVAAVNAAGLCGRSDWRMPSRDEALTLLDPARIGQGATLDPAYFPDAVAGEYWTGTTFRMYPQGAWAIDTVYAQDRVDWKSEPKRVRLVNGPKDAVKPKRRGK